MEEELQPQSSRPSSQLENRLFAAVSYISILFVVPLILKHDEDYVYFHARQGMALFLVEVVVWFILFMLESFLVALSPRGTIGIMGFLSDVAWLLFVVISLIGIYFAFIGKRWEMPVVSRVAKMLKV